MALVCGIDEAGRGPVIGPLVIAGAVIDEKDSDKLVAMGVKDSKMLTPRKREELFDQVKKMIVGYKIISVSPAEIDAALNSPDSNLNWLEADKSAVIVDKLICDKVILDAPSNNIDAYKEYFLNKVGRKVDVICEHKADEKYPVVGAASILAKVTRDREIEEIKRKLGVNFGSGYPADPLTAKFLRENYSKYSVIFRKTWASYKKLVVAKGQKGLGEF